MNRHFFKWAHGFFEFQHLSPAGLKNSGNVAPFAFKANSWDFSSLCGLPGVILCFSPSPHYPAPSQWHIDKVHFTPKRYLCPCDLLCDLFSTFSSTSLQGRFFFRFLNGWECNLVVFMEGGKLRVLLLRHLASLFLCYFWLQVLQLTLEQPKGWGTTPWKSKTVV